MTTGWPFLVARGRTRDYRTVLVPDVLADRGLHALLGDTLPIPEPGGLARTTIVEHPDTGPILVTYRSAVLQPADVDGPARDEHGRPLVYLYGMVHGPDEQATDLGDVREPALASYRRFLADEPGFAFDRSVAFPRTPPLAAPAAAVQQRLSHPAVPAPSIPDLQRTDRQVAGPRPAPSRPAASRSTRRPAGGRSLAVVGGGALVVLAVVAVLWLTRPSNPTLEVCAEDAGLRLTGEITLDAPGSVKFDLQVEGDELGTTQRPFVVGPHRFDVLVPAVEPAATGEVMITTTMPGKRTTQTYRFARCRAG